jgi:hypothetical protein
MLMCVFAGVSLLAPSPMFAALWSVKPTEYRALLGFGPIAGIAFLALAVPMAAASVGCFRSRSWGRTLAMVLIGVNALGDAARAATGGAAEGLIGLAIAGVLLWALTRRAIRAQFSQR